MTIAASDNPDTVPVPDGHVRLTVDGVTVDAPKGELIIRTAERLGVQIPRFCDHPLLDPAAACRQCLVEVEMGGRPMPKPQPACAITVADGMVVRTQHTSAVADKAQQGQMEFLLINHPLDCPICDKGGECPLQNQAMSNGRADSRFVDPKRVYAKPIAISDQILLDRERCVLCQRCTRFAREIAGDPFIELLERGALQQIGVGPADPAELAVTEQTQNGNGASNGTELDEIEDVALDGPKKPFASYFSGNVIQICPVGALTSAAYRFRSRPFDLVSTPNVCEHCASGCAQRSDWRRGHVTRRLAGEDPAVNEEWNCDKGRFAFTYATAPDRLRRPLVRDAQTNELREASWTEALRVAAEGLAKARDGLGAAVLPGGRLTMEDAYAYAKFARIALRTNDIDFRARAHSAAELDFLTGSVLGRDPDNGGVTYADLEAAPAVLSVAFEPEEESPIVFLRLRKAARKHGLRYFHIGQWTTGAVTKTSGTLLRCAPGEEVATVTGLDDDTLAALRQPGAVVLVGERAAELPGLFGAVRVLADRTGVRLAWIPRRAGERGALEAGAVPSLLPGGLLVTDASARAEVEMAWGMPANSLPTEPGRDTSAIIAAAAGSRLGALVVGGVDPLDLPDPELALTALSTVDFVVSLELRVSEVTRRADVVLPIAPAAEKSGSYLDWEGRVRSFRTTLEGTGALPDCRVLDTLAVEMDVDLFTQTPVAAAGDFERLGRAPVLNFSVADTATSAAPKPGPGQAVLATWRLLLDNGSLQDAEPHLAATAKVATAKLSAPTAAGLGVTFGELITVSTAHGSVTLPATEADLPNDVLWLPANSQGSAVRRTLGAGHGALVSVRGAQAGEPGGEH